MSTTLSTKRRTSALLSVSAMAATALIATAGTAGAAITTGGAADAEGRPGFARDAQGVALALCTAAEPFCEPADPADPLHGGYFGAEAQAGPVLAIFGIETAAGEDAEGNPTDEVLVANVARFRGESMPQGRYTIRHPWGRTTATVTAADQGELDLVLESGGEAGTLGAGVVKTFLRRTGAPAGFLGDLDSSGPVTGSPTGFNRVVVTGPNGRVVGQTSAFSVTGQMRANTAMSSMSTNSLKLGSTTTAGASTKSIRLDSFGTAPLNVTLTESGTNPGAFAARAVDLAGGDVRVDVTYTPRANRDASAILTINDGGLAAKRVTLTGTGPDTLRPRVEARSPKAGADNVALGKSVMVRFGEAVRGVKGSFTLTDQRTDRKVRASVQQVRQTNRWVLNPRSALKADRTYKVTLNGGAQALRDASGNAARDISWRFHTR